ncbi:MAG: bifunctional demethylmenaquinone methyltransferase/2-methoxy-6-polyprenyl-1,4-benzoquinol methylase, partial [Bacteroidota bacterium]
GTDFLKVLERVGFKNTTCTPLTFGVSSIYVGVK